MNEFISSPIELLQSLGAASNRCIAAIAYVTKDWLDFGEEDVIICDASDAAISARRTDRRLLSELVDRGVQVYSNPLLHSKLVVFDYRQAFVGSANLSQYAAQRIECGVLTSDRRTVEDAVKFILRLRDESALVDAKFLKRISRLEITTKGAPRLSKGQRDVLDMMQRDRSNAVNYWFFKGTQELSAKTQIVAGKLKARWERSVDEMTADDFEEVPDDLDPLDFHAFQQYDDRWRTQLSVGDKVFWCYEDSDWGWIVMPSRTVVSKKAHGSSVLAGTEGRYRDFENSIYRKQFLEAMSFPVNASLRQISADDGKLQDLLANWDHYAAEAQ